LQFHPINHTAFFKSNLHTIYFRRKAFIQATAQKVSELTVDVPRGNILDRNLIPLTNRKKKVDVVIQPLYLKDNSSDLQKISNILGLNFNEIKDRSK